MKFVGKLSRAIAWRLRVFFKPILKPLRNVMETPLAEDILYRLTEWRYDQSLKNLRPLDSSLPEVTIVIPIYNVSKYLNVCVKSALIQSHPNVRIVLVDDGSTDNSGVMAKVFEELYPNVKLVTQKNAGLAAARNAGAASIVSTDYLLFLDSDDVLPKHTVRNYLAAIGNLNVVVGKSTRLKGFWLYKRHRELFRRPVNRTDILSSVSFLSDVTATNKLIRFDFWTKGGFQFPKGYLYEDMALMTRVYCESGGFAVVNKCSYLWRARVGGDSSITQERWVQKNLEHRLKAIEDTLKVLREYYPKAESSKKLWDYYQWSTARFDISFYLPWVEHTDQKFFESLETTAKSLYADVDSVFWKKVPDRYRPALMALVANDRQGVIAAITKARLSVPKPAKESSD